jgi:hypothetical protein
MPSFVHPLLLWGLAIAAVPVLIHLINMLRHRRVEWAAMEFLLLSQKKHRTWIIFKQLLLLLLRMAAIAAVALLVAEPLLSSRFSRIFGHVKTHHVILLDDSYSMSDRWDDTSAFQEAKKVIARIGGEAAKQIQPQSVTLLRFSRVGKSGRPTQADFLNEQVANGFADQLKKVLDKCDASQSDAGPVEPLKALDELLGDPEGERRILYELSDFRTRQWNDPADAKKCLLKWQAAKADIHLIDCINQARPNLSIVSLQPEEGVRAAGVPWFMEVAVANHSRAAAKDVSVVLSEDGRARPSTSIAQIPPGRTAKERFQVIFPAAGWHTISARLEGDAVAADNYRFYAVDLPADLPVLLIDGDVKAKDAKFLDWLLNPGGAVKTGLRPTIETPRYLSMKPLDGFATINLADIDRLDRSAVAALEKFVAEGGGAAFFLGEKCQSKFFNQELYRDGKGLFPLPLKGPAELLVDRLEVAPDVQTEKHFIFRIFAEKRNSFLQSLLVQRYFAVADKWQPPADGSVSVLAKLRNGAPLAVEKSFGKGRVIAFLTTAAPTWNNWARNPGVVMFLDLQAYLCGRDAEAPAQLVGAPLEVTLDPAKYLPQVRFITPQEAGAPTATIDAAAGPDKKLHALLAETDSSGFYEALLTRSDNSSEIRRYAYNVEPAEGDLAALDQTQLAERLAKDSGDGRSGLKYQFERAAAFQTAQNESTGDNLRETILYALIILLIGEQLLAYSASYHPALPKKYAAAGGVR